MNQANTERPVYSDSETNDSNESVLLGESNTYSAISVVLIPKQMILMF